MEHFVLGLYVIAGSLGVATIIVVLLSYLRLGHRYYWRFVLFIASMTLLLQAEAVKTYGEAAANPPAVVLRVLVIFLGVAGTGLLGYAVPAFAFRMARKEQSPAQRVFHVCLAISLGALGALKELWGGRLWPDIHYAALLAVYIYGSLVLYTSRASVHSQAGGSLLRTFLIMNFALVVPGIAQLVLQNMSFWPKSLSFPFVQIAYYLWTVISFLLFATKYLFNPELVLSHVVSEEFVERYGISPRESEIITMMFQGHNNKKIGENLFISAVTVKNHIYHIYKKTGAGSKVQLLNLMNESARDDSQN